MRILLAVIAFAICTSSAKAVEYVTLHANNLSLFNQPSSLIEIIGWGGGTTSREWQDVKITFAQGNTELTRLANAGDSANTALISVPKKFAGITKIELINNYSFSVTLKITPAAEINAAGPTSVLVIPENSQGNYDVIVESSGDLVTWAPFLSQSVQSGANHNFFRTRIVKK